MTTNTNSMDNHGVAFHLLPRRSQSTEMVPCGHHAGMVEAEKAAKDGEWICKPCQEKEKGVRDGKE